MNSRGDALFGVMGIVGIILYLVLVAAYIFGIICSYIAITHSVKKRAIVGEDFSAGKFFLWVLGWGCATAYSGGLATVIYFFVKRSDINATKATYTQMMANIRQSNTQYYQQQPQMYSQQPPSSPQQHP